LSLVRTAVERHGGHLVIESDPDKGSTFTLVLPAAGRSDLPHGPRQAIVLIKDARVRAIAAALLAGVGVEVSVQRPADSAAVDAERQRATSRGFLWVVDESVDPLDVLRFLEEGGPSVRVVVLGNSVPIDPESAGEAAAHDGRLIRIVDPPSYTTLQIALRRAVIGWAP
jgi:hypothetical protein